MTSVEAAEIFAVKGLVAVITGGGSGIGLMMAKALALNGAHKVYIIGRRKEVLEAAAKESPHGNIIPLVGDATSKDSLRSIATYIEKDTGYVNVIIANSGILGPRTEDLTPDSSLEEFQSTLWNAPFEEYTQTFAVNTSAVYYTIVAFLMLLDAGNKKGNLSQKSQVIATSSIGGFNRSAPGGYAYGQSKAATTLLMKQLATKLVPYRIRANVIAPGRTVTLILFSSSHYPELKIPSDGIAPG
ncbi:short chain dehydrogenase [Lasallia pustulata]|uniref:Short chain dehydrogenase n=1 Tax=Lasallia pustulata TaxID=136370 RepID=A0A1W5CXD1_9LECA|nr:short chain dehydrogenase [Lasallia pustulata]